MIWLLALLIQAQIVVPDQQTNAWLRTWIPPSCCVTNNCCFQVPSTSVRPLPNDQWQILATGQVLKRTDFSQDGKYWRCACDWDGGQWVVHEKAMTRCIFPPMSMM